MDNLAMEVSFILYLLGNLILKYSLLSPWGEFKSKITNDTCNRFNYSAD